MRSPRYCIYNQTNECFLSLGTRPGCDPFSLLNRLFFRRPDSVDEGYWLAPLRRLKTLGFFSSHDLLYLDDHQNVVDVVESLFLPRIAPGREDASSLLVLPTSTVSASHTQIGNRLVILPPDEMEIWLRKTLAAKPENVESNGESKSIQTVQSVNRLVDRFRERRESSRKDARSLCAHYRHHGSMAVTRIRDISVSGLYLVTGDRWPVGTRVTMTLELKDAYKTGTTNPILVHLKVARWGADGLGLEFVSPPHDVARMECESLFLN